MITTPLGRSVFKAVRATTRLSQQHDWALDVTLQHRLANIQALSSLIDPVSSYLPKDGIAVDTSRHGFSFDFIGRHIDELSMIGLIDSKQETYEITLTAATALLVFEAGLTPSIVSSWTWCLMHSGLRRHSSTRRASTKLDIRVSV